jgi:catechol 2,3-dioxygenase-like lactoylglutathione lyase family enzyme
MGASAHGIRMGRYEGTVVETRLDTGVIALFLGWDIAADSWEQAKKDVRVVFVEKGGAQHVVPFQAGGCSAMFFTSPAGLATTELSAWVLQRKASAAWAEEAAPSQPSSSSDNGAGLNRVTGIGGVFFKSKDPKALGAWYKTHLGIDVQDWGGATFRWKGPGNPEGGGTTAWMPFAEKTKYFAPSTAPFMINYRVADLFALLAALSAEGVQVDEKVQESEDGKFAWIMDPDGNKLELWQPPDGK